jgi:hypothetical protein
MRIFKWVRKIFERSPASAESDLVIEADEASGQRRRIRRGLVGTGFRPSRYNVDGTLMGRGGMDIRGRSRGTRGWR